MQQNERRWWMWGAGALLAAALGLTAHAGIAVAATTWLGVYTQDLTPALREGLDYNGKGVLVSDVVDGGPAAKAGFDKGDVITRFNSREVDDAEDLVDLVRGSSAGAEVAVQVVREGRTRTLNVRLEARDEDAVRYRAWSSDDEDDDVRVRIERRNEGDNDNDNDSESDNDRSEAHWFRLDGDDLNLPDMRGLAPMAHAFRFRGRLGVELQDLNQGLGEYFGTNEGALIVNVVEDSPAEKAGLRAGDVIVSFGGEDIEDAGDLSRAVREADEGAVEVALIRKGNRMTVRPELGEPVRGFAWQWDGGDQKRVRELADRAREHAGRMGERGERISERELRRALDRMGQQLRELELRLEEMDEDGK